jgi:hypothetical protein
MTPREAWVQTSGQLNKGDRRDLRGGSVLHRRLTDVPEQGASNPFSQALTCKASHIDCEFMLDRIDPETYQLLGRIAPGDWVQVEGPWRVGTGPFR